jgi:4-hydroxy-4-methyl-2-oxoglutarate aldolase
VPRAVSYPNCTDWWHFVESLPAPKIIVVADIDRIPGTGALLGEIHARIAQALGCVAYVTNGTVRDLAGLKAAEFQCFESGTSVSHAYAHIIEFGEPVDLGGLTISTGDLLHGDCHGVHAVPLEIADELPREVERLILSKAVGHRAATGHILSAASPALSRGLGVYGL